MSYEAEVLRRRIAQRADRARTPAETPRSGEAVVRVGEHPGWRDEGRFFDQTHEQATVIALLTGG